MLLAAYRSGAAGSGVADEIGHRVRGCRTAEEATDPVPPDAAADAEQRMPTVEVVERLAVGHGDGTREYASLRNSALTGALPWKRTIGSETQFSTTTDVVAIAPVNSTVPPLPKLQPLIVRPLAASTLRVLPGTINRSFAIVMLVLT